MSSQEDTWEKLDSEFDHYLVDMKPYVLKLPHTSERQRCALWIKKLCDPSGSGAGIMGRKNRNLYARLLLHMLRRGVLEGPFTHRPEPGSLKTLPTYMSIYFDEPLCGRPLEQGSVRLPDWVTGELGPNEEPWSSPPRERLLSPASAPRAHRLKSSLVIAEVLGGTEVPSHAEPYRLAKCRIRLVPENTTSPDGIRTHCRITLSMPTPIQLGKKKRKIYEGLMHCLVFQIENPRYLREKPIPLSPISLKASLGKNSTFCDDQTSVHTHEKELEMKTKVLEARCHEEKLKMQQKHDADVQKILDRKNNEIEELKTLYRNKQKESEETIRKLEKKVQSLVRESQVIRESKEQQIAELKKISDQSADSLKNEWEKKLHNAVAEMEQEKFELQKKHTENIQELLDDTNARLAKMEAEYGAQTQATVGQEGGAGLWYTLYISGELHLGVLGRLTIFPNAENREIWVWHFLGQGGDQMVKELEARVQQLTVEVESSNALRQKVSQEKAELEIQVAGISAELQEACRRNNSLLKEKDQLSEQHEQSVRRMQTKRDADLSHLQQEHALSAAKASEVIEELEKMVTQLKQELRDTEHRRQKQLREQESKFHQETSNLEHIHDKKVRALQSEADRDKADAMKKMGKLEEALREKEEQLGRLAGQQKLQAQQAEQALEQFRRQVELSSEKAYSDMKQQMEKVEADLARSKCLREKQSKEFTWQLEELKQRYEQQLGPVQLPFIGGDPQIDLPTGWGAQQWHSKGYTIHHWAHSMDDQAVFVLRSGFATALRDAEWVHTNAHHCRGCLAMSDSLAVTPEAGGDNHIRLMTGRCDGIVELKLEHEQEKTHLFQQHNAEKDSLVQDHEREIENLEKQSRAAMLQHESQTQEWRKRDTQAVAALEAQVQRLREELVRAGAQRKQQLLELSLQREEERQRATQEQEAALGRLRAEMDRARVDLERAHAAERQAGLEQTNSRLKQIEKEYSQKLAKSSQTITELQTSLSTVREESRQRQRAAENQLQETAARWEEERRQLLRDHEREIRALQDKIENLQSLLNSTEKKLLNKELEHQEQVTRVRQECEMKIKGLMPAALRQELEDTIASLKSQASRSSRELRQHAQAAKEQAKVYSMLNREEKKNNVSGVGSRVTPEEGSTAETLCFFSSLFAISAKWHGASLKPFQTSMKILGYKKHFLNLTFLLKNPHLCIYGALSKVSCRFSPRQPN
ncbi:CE112 protein, partial [Atractosteus spatula]|nr:CE112 protein [Atractosteus spatula]